MTVPTADAILIVNDRASDLLALTEALEPLGVPIRSATGGAQALEIAATVQLSVGVVDIRMPDIDGLEVGEKLRRTDRNRTVPLVFASVHEPDRDMLLRIYNIGRADFILLPAPAEALRAKVAVFVELGRRLRPPMASLWERTDSPPADMTERLRLLTEASSDYALLFLDVDGVITDWTLSAQELFGYTAEEVVGRSAAIIFTPEDRATHQPELEIAQAVHAGQTKDERTHLRKDGSRFPAAGRLIALREHAEGRLRGFAKVVRDATHLRAIEEQESKFREIFETANEGIWILDADSRIETVNQRMAEMLGYRIDEILGRRKADFAFSEDQAYIQQLFEERRTGRVVSSVDVRFRHRNGHAVYTLLSARPRFQGGQFVGAIDMFTDVTVRKRTEEELEEHRTRLRLAIDAADLGVFYRDGFTGRDTWNDQVKRLLGLPLDVEPSVATFLDTVHPDDRAAMAASIQPLFDPSAGSREFAIEFRVVWPDRTVHYLAANGLSQPRTSAEGLTRAHIVGTVRDLTAAKEFELELQRKVDERTGELNEKTSQLESFIYTVAHDLRAPLRAINGYADLVIEEYERMDRDQAVGHLERIKASTRRLDALIRDLLTYSRIAQVNVALDSVDLAAVVRTALREMDAEIQSRRAHVVVGSDLPPVTAERSILEQIVINLVSNAVKFTPADRAPQVDIFAEPHEGFVRLCVRDQGIGIPPEYHARIFKVFERLQTSRQYPGTGIGLAIVARAAERLGARYGVESSPGQGSTFWIEMRRPSS